MTREEAIEILNCDKLRKGYFSVNDILAIEILKQEPKIDGDCISRQAVLDKVWDVLYDGEYIQVVDVGDIEDLPSVTPTLKTGHWIVGNYHVKCSVCGEDYPYRVLNYCPNCGARMSEESEDGSN